MTKYANLTNNATQRERAFGKNQVKNNAGGYVFKISEWDKLNRFLILGSDKNTYYTKASKLTKENAKNIINLIEKDGFRVVDEAVKISVEGRAPKNDPAIFVMALACAFGDNNVKSYAFSQINDVCRTATHLFQFVDDVTKFRGWGRGLRECVANWYTQKPIDKLVYQIVKYKNREGWTHKDVITLSHPMAVSDDMSYVFNKVVKGYTDLPSLNGDNVEIDKFNVGMNFDQYLMSFYNDRNSGEEYKYDNKTVKDAVELIKKYSLPREVVPNYILNEIEIWESLMSSDGKTCTMPMTAMIRNLGKMTSIGYLKPLSDGTIMVCEALRNKDAIKKARIHPITILIALKTYSSGGGFKGNNSWCPVPAIESALEDAFYLAFDNVEPTNKRHLVALDVSGSMTMFPVGNLRSCEITAAMSMILLRTEPNVHVVGFCDTMRPLGITKNDKLVDVCNKVVRNNFGNTDASAAIEWAMDNNIKVDVFSVWTDNETWCGKVHPYEMLQRYRNRMGIKDAKLVVCATTSTDFSIADPDDKGMLDIAGFDASVPNIIAEFSKGNI